jgi:hypothetical protein
MSRTLIVSSSAMMKLSLIRPATGKEDPVTSVAEGKFIKVNCTSDCSPNKRLTEFK